MPQQYRPNNPEPMQSSTQKPRLSRCGPGCFARARARALAVADARLVEDRDAKVTGKGLDQAADDKIVGHGTVAVQQHDRDGRRMFVTVIQTVKPHAIGFDELTGRWMALPFAAGS